MAGRISMGARREITAAVVDRYRSAGRADKGRILDELCAVTGWHRKHAVRALAILGRLAEHSPEKFGPPQHTIVQRLLRSLRRNGAKVIIPRTVPATTGDPRTGAVAAC